jgi:putative membrane protein
VPYLRIAFLLAGVALLALIVRSVDLAEVARLVTQLGWGLAAVLALYLLAFVVDTASWQLALPAAPLTARWLARLWAVRMIGEAFNATLPAGSVGGEPVKAMLLKRHYDVGYRDATASLILTRTVNLIALVLFLAVGFGLILADGRLAFGFKAAAGAGLAVFAAAILGFFLVQRYRLSSVIAGRASRWRGARRIAGALEHVHDIDGRFVRFYAGSPARFSGAAALALFNWVLGAVEVYMVMEFLGHPVGFTDAWVIEAAAQLVRTGTFFIPASIGAQEGAFVVLYAVITGSPTQGVAMALVRRIREILWIGWGFALGPVVSRTRPVAQG